MTTSPASQTRLHRSEERHTDPVWDDAALHRLAVAEAHQVVRDRGARASIEDPPADLDDRAAWPWCRLVTHHLYRHASQPALTLRKAA